MHYLNIQDCAGGLGHRVLMWGLPWGKAIALSVRHSTASHAAKTGGICPGCHSSKCSEHSGHTQPYCEMKTPACLRGWSPRILQGNLWEASPCVGTGCFLFECALLSPPDNFLSWGWRKEGGNHLRLLAAFIGRLRKFKQGKISAEVSQINSWEGISWGHSCSFFRQLHAMCVPPVLLCFISCSEPM